MTRLLQITTVAATLRAFLLPFAHHFRQVGWRVDAMAQGVSQSPECAKAFDKLWEIAWSRNPFDLRNLLVVPRIQDIMEHEQYDIVHVHTPVAAFIARYALRNVRRHGKCKVIYTAHGFHFHRHGQPLINYIFLRMEKLAACWTDYLILINKEDIAAANEHNILPSERIRYMPGIGIDLAQYDPAAVAETAVAKVRQELNLAPENSLFLCIGELNARKRPADAIRGFAKAGLSRAHLAFAGNGPLLSKMRQLASKLGVKERIHFLGKRDDIPSLVRASLATVSVSQQEGLPRSVMESLALEIPVIGSNIRGTQELIENGCGLLVKVGDADQIARAMIWTIEHPDALIQMGSRGRQRMTTYALHHIVALHQELYAEALAGAPSAPIP